MGKEPCGVNNFTLGGGNVPIEDYDILQLWNPVLNDIQVVTFPFSDIRNDVKGQFSTITQKKGIARGIGVNGRTKEVSGLEGIRIYFNGVDPGPLTVTLRGVRNIMAKYTPNAK